MPFGLLGLLAGRYTKLLVLVLLPIPVFWVLYETSYKGEGDDITGPATTFLAILGMGGSSLALWSCGAFVMQDEYRVTTDLHR